ncbi:FACT complex subunit SPT16 [Striga hermonthica]|uniref:FACT complex subunit n=1 Tax=Striga hermonthica TaxID=68872 RepID=A0A9N7P3J7_STRHE|nr:FACT complex subunit SPT16 [Striga hermonthica]
MVFGSKQIHFLCSQKKASLLEAIKEPAKESLFLDVVMHVKAKNENGINQMDSILHAIRSEFKSSDQNVPTVGCIARESPEGKLLKTWFEKLKKTVKKAIDEEKKVTHASLTNDTEKALLDPAKIGLQLKAENVDICYPPIFQSGGNFDLRTSASSNDEYLYYDSSSIIICSVESRYNSYYSNIARTYLIDLDVVQSKAYRVLLQAHEVAILAVRPRKKARVVYEAALSVVKTDAPDFLPNLTKSAGTGISLEFRESGLSLDAENEKVLKAGMALNVSIGF